MAECQAAASGELPPIEREEAVPASYSRGKSVPWWMKLGSKLVLSRLPVPYAVWRKLGIFRHGRSDERWTRERTFATECLELAKGELGRFPKTVLELGPGDSLVGAIVSAAHGVERISIVDVGDFASVDVDRYRLLVEELDAVSPGFSKRVDLTSRSRLLESIHASYFTDGLHDLAEIPKRSVELTFSLKVMEHVRRAEFQELMQLIARASAPQAIQRHVVDLHDHMGCALNNLRFSSAFWEHPIVSRSGFYTNRLRFSEIVEIAQQTGFTVAIPHALLWPRVPISRDKLHDTFQPFSDQDLRVCMFDMVLRKA